MKTIDDAVIELEGKAHNADYYGDMRCETLVCFGPGVYVWVSAGSRTDIDDRIVCTRDQFNRRAAELGYWVEWEATERSECPVDLIDIVEFQMRNGDTEKDVAEDLDWTECGDGTITRYRIAQPAEAEQFEVFWVDKWQKADLIGEYNGHRVFGFLGSMAALECDLSVRTRPSERERWIEAAVDAAGPWLATAKGVSRIYDAGLARMAGEL